MFKIKVINSTIRPGRKSPIIANWITSYINEQNVFEAEFLDLGEINLPLMNEPNHPILKNYEHDYSKKWSAKIEEADAFIFVTAEYDYNYPAPLRNAIEYLYHEWAFKAAGIVSYGGISAGTRAATNLKSDLSVLRVVPIPVGVPIPFFSQFINDEGEFVPNEATLKAAETMLAELLRWTKGLKSVREDH
jgi:NAD(P)H-dependent FMN reductase